MNDYEVLYQATIVGVARVTAKSDKAAERKVRNGGNNGLAAELLREAVITETTVAQARAIPAKC